MAKSKVSEWDSVAGNNIIINGININENCPPSAVNNAIREMMAQIKDWQSGASGDDWTSDGTLNITGSLKLDGNLGSSGQVIESQGSTATPKWKTLGTMSYQNSSSVTTGDLNITGALRLDNSVGSNGQVLKSVGSTATPVWTTLGTMSTQNSNAVNITGGSVKTTGDLNVTGALKLDNSVGSTGQVLVSSGSSATPTWGNAFVRGMIMLWSGSTGTVPSGWALCNGGFGTPDLTNRFVIGAGNSYAVNAKGGSANAVVVSHTHSLSGNTGSAGAQALTASTSVTGTTTSAGNHSHTLPHYLVQAVAGTGDIDRDNEYQQWKALSGQSTRTSGSHSHGLSISASTSVSSVSNHTHPLSGNTGNTNGGVSGTNKNLPPYYALAYIMKL